MINRVVAGIVAGVLSVSSSAIAQETAWGLNEIQKDKVKTVICEFYGQGYKDETILDELSPKVEAIMMQNYLRRKRERPSDLARATISTFSEARLAMMQLNIRLGNYPCEHIDTEQ